MTVVSGDANSPQRHVESQRSYTRLRTLGKGAHAKVDEVMDNENHQVYARKIFRCDDDDEFHTTRSRFCEEVKIMAKLSNSPLASRRLIAEFVRAHEDNEKLEFSLILLPVADCSLRDLLVAAFREPSVITPDVSRKLDTFCIELAEGLFFIHGESVRHKDIKPENILVHMGHIKYADFGISLDYGATGSSITNSDKPCYSAAYAAPELLRLCRGARDVSSDVFSLGCIFYELLATYGGVSGLRSTSIEGDEFVLYGYMARDGRLNTAIESCLIVTEDEKVRTYMQVTKSMLALKKQDRPTAQRVMIDFYGAHFEAVYRNYELQRQNFTYVYDLAVPLVLWQAKKKHKYVWTEVDKTQRCPYCNITKVQVR